MPFDERSGKGLLDQQHAVNTQFGDVGGAGRGAHRWEGHSRGALPAGGLNDFRKGLCRGRCHSQDISTGGQGCRLGSRSMIGGGGDVTNLSPFWEGMTRK